MSPLLPLAVSIPTEPVEAATGHSHDLNHGLSNEFCKGRCKPVGRTVFLERSAEPVAQRTLLHYFSKEKTVLPHNGQKGCNTPRFLPAAYSQLQERTGWKRGSYVSADPAFTLLRRRHCAHKGYCCSPVGPQALSSSRRPWIWGLVSLLFPSSSDAEECGICMWGHAERLLPADFPWCAGGIVFQPRVMETTTQPAFLPSLFVCFLPVSLVFWVSSAFCRLAKWGVDALASPLAELSQSRGPSSYPRWILIYSGGLAPLADVLHFTISDTQLSAERATCCWGPPVMTTIAERAVWNAG